MDGMVNLETFAGGALAAQINKELGRVINNIYDPNTDAGKARKINITISFKPNTKRTTAGVTIQAKSTLAPFVPQETTIMIDKDFSTGQIIAAEIGNKIAGQLEMELEDVEEKAPEGANIIDLKKVNENK